MVGTAGLAQLSVRDRLRWEEDDAKAARATRMGGKEPFSSPHHPLAISRSRGSSAQELGAKIQADAHKSLRRLKPDWSRHWFGAAEGSDTKRVNKEDANPRPSQAMKRMAHVPAETPRRLTRTQAVHPDVVRTMHPETHLPIRSERPTESAQLSTADRLVVAHSAKQRMREERFFIQGRLKRLGGEIGELLDDCVQSSASMYIPSGYISELVSLRSRTVQLAAGLMVLTRGSGEEKLDAVLSIRSLLVAQLNAFDQLKERHSKELEQAQAERVGLYRQQVLARLEEEISTFRWLQLSVGRQANTLAGSLTNLWEEVGEHFTGRAPATEAIAHHSTRQYRLAEALRREITSAGASKRDTWKRVERVVKRVEGELSDRNFPPQLRRMLEGRLAAFKRTNHAVASGLESSAELIGMAAGEGAKYLLTLAFPGFLPLIHIGWDAMAEISHQTILDGRIVNPGEVLWKGLTAGIAGSLATETRTISEAFATRALRADIVRGVSDETLRSFVKVFGIRAVETVKDGFILGPIHRVLTDPDIGKIVANPQRFGTMIFEEVKNTCDVSHVMKTLINEGLFQSVRGTSRL